MTMTCAVLRLSNVESHISDIIYHGQLLLPANSRNALSKHDCVVYCVSDPVRAATCATAASFAVHLMAALTLWAVGSYARGSMSAIGRRSPGRRLQVQKPDSPVDMGWIESLK